MTTWFIPASCCCEWTAAATPPMPQLQMDHWHNFRWQMFCAEPDTLDTQIVRHLARQLSKWDSAPIGRQDAESAAAQTMLSLLGITNAANLDVTRCGSRGCCLWARASRWTWSRC